MKIPIRERIRAVDVPGPPPLSGIIPKSIRKQPGPIWPRSAFLDKIHRSDLCLRYRTRACEPKRRPAKFVSIPFGKCTERRFKESETDFRPEMVAAIKVWKIENPKKHKAGIQTTTLRDYRQHRDVVMDFGIRNRFNVKPMFTRVSVDRPSPEIEFASLFKPRTYREVVLPGFVTMKTMSPNIIPNFHQRNLRKRIS